MPPTWDKLWQEHEQIFSLLDLLSPSQLQKTFLGGLVPSEVPAIGLELSRVGLRRRPQMAALLLGGRTSRWATTLAPLLSLDGRFADGLQVIDLQPLIKAQSLFYPESWVEWNQPPRLFGGQSFMVFRKLAQLLTVEDLESALFALHAMFSDTLQQRMPLPNPAWFRYLATLPLLHLDQLGVNLHPQLGGWKLLFSVSNPKALFDQLSIAPSLRKALEPFPVQMAFDTRDSTPGSFALEVFPLYRHHHTITGYPGPIPCDLDQWPSWPEHACLLPRRRLNALVRGGVHLSATPYEGQQVGLRGGLSHQKLLFRQGDLYDHKAYLGVMLTSPMVPAATSDLRPSIELDHSARPADLAISLLCNASQSWSGFELLPGASDVWVPLACLTLLAPLREHQRLGPTYARMLSRLEPVLTSGEPVGYNSQTPADLDSTIWLLRCLQQLGRPLPPELCKWVSDSWQPECGCSTYPFAETIATYINHNVSDVGGWCAPHDCVLANLAAEPALPHAATALQLLRKKLRAQSFSSYWWPLDGLILSLLPRGCLPSSAVRQLANQQLSAPLLASMPQLNARRLQTFSLCLLLLRHGRHVEQQRARDLLVDLLQRPEDLCNLLVMQLPEPGCFDPGQHEDWSWQGRFQGSLAPDLSGYLSASLLVNAALSDDLLRGQILES